MKTEYLEEWQKKCNFNDAVCDALLLQFKGSIPNVQEVREFIGTAVYEICENSDGWTNRDTYYYNIHQSKCKNPQNISKRLLDAIVDLTCEGTHDSWIRVHLWMGDRFLHGWQYGKGDSFRFKDRRKRLNQIRKHFNNTELAEFDKMGKIMRRECGKRQKEKENE